MTATNVLKEQETQETEIYPVIFQLGLKALIRAKSNTLIQLRQIELGLINAKHELKVKERKLILNTDFKELGLTNEKMRNAYVDEQLNNDKIKIDVEKHRIASKKDDIEVINDLIKLHELEIAGE